MESHWLRLVSNHFFFFFSHLLYKDLKTCYNDILHVSQLWKYIKQIIVQLVYDRCTQNLQPQTPQTGVLGNFCTKILILVESSYGYQIMIKEFPITE